MFYYFSKLFWLVADPVNLIGLLLALSIVLGVLRLRRWALAFSCAALLVLALGAWTSIGALMLHPLEDHFVRPDPVPSEIGGIVVLGGGMEGGINLVRGGYELASGGDRLVEAAVLARRFPDAPILVSGGSGALTLEGEGDAASAPRLLEALGVARDRLILENRSRNTHENAVLSRRLVEPESGQSWLLVTSAFHMPRSVGLFRKAGFDVVPWPADYRARGDERFGLARHNGLDALRQFSLALREWLGLVAYRLTGRIDSLFPEQ